MSGDGDPRRLDARVDGNTTPPNGTGHTVAACRVTRRTVMMTVGTGAAALAGLASCASGDGGDNQRRSKLTGAARELTLAAALDNLAEASYAEALRKVAEGGLGVVAPAVVDLFNICRQQHAEHAAKWNGLLSGAGGSKVDGSPLGVAEKMKEEMRSATSIAAVLRAARAVEELAAHTCARAVAGLSQPEHVDTAALIQPVEFMHLAVLDLLLGSNPAPSAFATTDRGLAADDLRLS